MLKPLLVSDKFSNANAQDRPLLMCRWNWDYVIVVGKKGSFVVELKTLCLHFTRLMPSTSEYEKLQLY